ncbi:MAG: response regulator [Burkholderiales bacterium]
MDRRLLPPCRATTARLRSSSWPYSKTRRTATRRLNCFSCPQIEAPPLYPVPRPGENESSLDGRLRKTARRIDPARLSDAEHRTAREPCCFSRRLDRPARTGPRVLVWRPYDEREIIPADECRSARTRLLVAMLEAEGYVGLEAAGGAQALRLAQQSPPDLILLDIMMPDMDGFEVVIANQRTARTRRRGATSLRPRHDGRARGFDRQPAQALPRHPMLDSRARRIHGTSDSPRGTVKFSTVSGHSRNGVIRNAHAATSSRPTRKKVDAA